MKCDISYNSSSSQMQKDLALISKKKKAYFKHVIGGIITWLIVQCSWVYYWIFYHVNAFKDMSLIQTLACFFSLAIPIIVVAITHRKYSVLAGYESILKHVDEYSKKTNFEKNMHDNIV